MEPLGAISIGKCIVASAAGLLFGPLPMSHLFEMCMGVTDINHSITEPCVIWHLFTS